MKQFEIKFIPYDPKTGIISDSQIYQIRYNELWKEYKKFPEECTHVYDMDQASPPVHFGAYNNTQLCGVLSLRKRGSLLIA